jgi:hypothetical protein
MVRSLEEAYRKPLSGRPAITFRTKDIREAVA